MKRILVILCSAALLFAACNENKIDKSDPLESGRGFIEASLKGDYITADKYLLPDSTNMEYFQTLKDFNNKMSKEERYSYSTANIIIDSTVMKSDSVEIIYYSNTFKKKPSKIKMVKKDKDWLVDFKYTFSDN